MSTPLGAAGGRTPAVLRAVLVAAVLLTAAVVAGRPDLAVAAVPFVVGTVTWLRSGGVRGVDVRWRLSAARSVEQGQVDAVVTLLADDDVDVAELVVGTGAPRLLVLTAGEPLTVSVPVPTPRWGRQRVGPVELTPVGAGLLLRGRRVRTGVARVSVLPAVDLFTAADVALPSRQRSGNHRSRTPGPGVEPVAVRPYAVGDRRRQVDWRATSRVGELHVRATSTERTTDVVVLLDALLDLGAPGSTVLDTEVRAATGLVEHYLGAGDAVELVQFGGRLRTLRSGSGRGQLARAREWLLDVALPVNDAVAAASALWVPSAASSRALVLVLTPLVDERTSVLLATLRRSGTSVLAVDVLPAEALAPGPDDPTVPAALARRLWLLERDALVARLGELGVPVVPWQGPGSLDAVLGALVRTASAPRVGVR